MFLFAKSGNSRTSLLSEAGAGATHTPRGKQVPAASCLSYTECAFSKKPVDRG